MRITKSVLLAIPAAVLGLGLSSALQAQSAGQGAAPPPQQASEAAFEVKVESNVKIPMRDGTKLATDLYKPAGPGPFPVMLQRTPYGRTGERLTTQARWYAARGFVVALQDTRGRFDSEGEFRNYLDDGWGERKDGYDTIEWLGTQSWSNGKVGTYGNSYSGTVQYQTAVTRPPHLTAMFVNNAAADAYQEVRYHGGAFMGHGIRWDISFDSFTQKTESEDDWDQILRTTPKDRALTLQDFISPTLREVIATSNDGPFWWQTSAYRKFPEIDVPTYHVGGWFDRYRRGISKSFAGISTKGRTEQGRKAQKLLMGPWPHSDRGPRVTAGVDFGAAAAENMDQLRLRWFEYWLKGVDNGIMNEPPVRLFVMGDNQWRTEQEWPIARAVPTPFYLRAGSGTPTRSLNDGVLSREASASASDKPDTYTYDPRQPLRTLGDDTRFGEQGPVDQRPIEQKSLTYTTPALTEPLEVTGYPEAVLHVSSDAVDTDFVVILSDVAPDGTSRVLTRNLLRAKYHKSFEKPELLKPGKVYELKFELSPTSQVLQAGHQLRVSISSSSYPAWIPNSNTGKNFGEGGAVKTAVNTVYRDSARPSRVILPIIPKGRQTSN